MLTTILIICVMIVMGALAVVLMYSSNSKRDMELDGYDDKFKELMLSTIEKTEAA